MRRLCSWLRWWLDERRLPWCESCQMRHTPQAGETTNGVRTGNSLRSLLYQSREEE